MERYTEKSSYGYDPLLIFVKHPLKSWNTSLLVKRIQGDSQGIKFMLMIFF